jgi:hypothetical protein
LPEDLDDAVEVLEHLAQILERLPSLVAGRKLH